MEKAVKCTQNLLPDFAQVYSIAADLWYDFEVLVPQKKKEKKKVLREKKKKKQK